MAAGAAVFFDVWLGSSRKKNTAVRRTRIEPGDGGVDGTARYRDNKRQTEAAATGRELRRRCGRQSHRTVPRAAQAQAAGLHRRGEPRSRRRRRRRR